METLSDSFLLPISPDRAWRLFTADGERRWVAGWEPTFPAGDDDELPGTVFTTESSGLPTFWVVTSVEPGRRLGYAKVTPGDLAGSVTVELSPTDDEDSTQVTVTYRLTALDDAARPGLADFARTFPEFLAGWRRAILEQAPGGIPEP